MVENLLLSKRHRFLQAMSRFLCMTILLTSLFSTFRFVDGFYFFASEPSGLRSHSEITTQPDYYPFPISEQFILRTTLQSHLSVGYQRRVPLRFPIPPMFLLLSCFLYGLLMHRHKKRRAFSPPEVADNPYTIRYIHNQNGETYHSFLF